jgi:GH15 family glucan-1,4-alpha-glucosidase
VLLTRFLSSEGVGEITDFMPVATLGRGKTLIRRLTSVRGNIEYVMRCSPRFNYGRDGHRIELVADNEALIISEGPDKTALRFNCSSSISVEGQDITGTFVIPEGTSVDFMLADADCSNEGTGSFSNYVTESLYSTVNYWKEWVAGSSYMGRWRAIVHRSALVLKLLTSHEYGAIVAAPTFGLPETVGGDRNWDYRYTWIRDASFSTYAFMKLGFVREAGAFMQWVEKLCQDISEHNRLGIMYSIDGSRQLEEMSLTLFEGYRKSLPVRIGNNAYGQLQLDIYGELMDAVYQYNRKVEPLSYDFWKDMEDQMDWLCHNWQRPDESIWEVRGGQKHFLYSRLQCWVAFDRAIKIAESRSFPYSGSWRTERDKIFNSIYNDYWDNERKAFMQYPGATTVDASALLMPLLKFISPKDPRWLSTLQRIEDELVSDSLVYRYRPELAAPDGFLSHEGTFSMCTFWYVECLSRAGQLDKARLIFEKMLGYANHVGLYAEQLGFEGEHLGNFPQAFTHLGLISAAHNLDQQLNDRKNRNINI